MEVVELRLGARECTGALLVTVKNALPFVFAAAADGGPAVVPATNVPPGAETDDTSGTRDSAAA